MWIKEPQTKFITAVSKTNSVAQDFIEKMIVTQLVRKSPAFVETASSSTSLQKFDIGSHTEPAESIHLCTLFFSDPSTPWTSKWCPLSTFSDQNIACLFHFRHVYCSFRPPYHYRFNYLLLDNKS
jgi:hypothetical protein